MIATLNLLNPYAFLLWMTCVSTSFNGSEIKGHWEPGKLAQYSDVVFVGEQVSETVFRVEQVWKGVWDERLIEIRDLDEFTIHGMFNRDQNKVVSNRCLIFIRTRPWNVIVANGLFRARPDGKLLGFRQQMSPGPYCLEPESQYGSLEEIKKLVDAAETQRPILQRESLRRLSSLFWDDAEFVKLHAELIGDSKEALTKRDEYDSQNSFSATELKNELDHLGALTSVRDDWVFSTIDGMLGRNEDWDYEFTEFFSNFPNPIVERSLIREYDQNHETRIFGLLARLGLPSTAQYLKSVVLDCTKHARQFSAHEHQYPALVGLSQLYSTLAERHEDRAALAVATEVYALMDESAEASNNAIGILSSIPDEGSIERLNRLLEQERTGNRSESQIRELEYAIETCAKRLAAKRGIYSEPAK